ncbi:MAG: TniQ family protein [Beijerinckiaceae bacterium]|nr:TniQ family protein [Beijerinckiaceae bacterium]
MSLSDLFDIAPIAEERADGLVRLPHHVEPIEGEALFSWLMRLGRSLDLTPRALSRDAFGVDALAAPEWWRRPDDRTLGSIARRSGVSRDRLEAMTLRGWATARDDENADRFSADRWGERQVLRRGRRIAICRQCLAEAARPNLQLVWMLGWTGICARHRTVLVNQCGACRCLLRIASLATNRRTDLLMCRRCGSAQGGSSGEAAHGSTIALQATLIHGKRTGRTRLPGLGPLDWRMTVAFIDRLLAKVWSSGSDERHERLFATIAADIDMTDELWVTRPWRSNYGGLLILAWVLHDLEARSRIMVSTLGMSRRDDLVGSETVNRVRGFRREFTVDGPSSRN